MVQLVARVICALRANEAAKKFLVFERPDKNVLVLATHSQQGVVRTERETANVCLVVKSHEALSLVASYVIELYRLVHRKSHDEPYSALVRRRGQVDV